jgi:hypothetical protein
MVILRHDVIKLTRLAGEQMTPVGRERVTPKNIYQREEVRSQTEKRVNTIQTATTGSHASNRKE